MPHLGQLDFPKPIDSRPPIGELNGTKYWQLGYRHAWLLVRLLKVAFYLISLSISRWTIPECGLMATSPREVLYF